MIENGINICGKSFQNPRGESTTNIRSPSTGALQNPRGESFARLQVHENGENMEGTRIMIWLTYHQKEEPYLSELYLKRSCTLPVQVHVVQKIS
uniref:Uncharacterized protein n=1 Tax=Manihot esculenta TaxID=3983 RepID=A0A2C9WLH8_MANES